MNVELKQIIFRAVNEVAVVSSSQDLRPGPGEIAGPALFSLVSSGTEVTGLLSGNLKDIAYPAYPGYAAIFRVDEVGDGVSDFRVGDIAFCMGNHQSYHVSRAESAVCVPSDLAPEIAPLSRLMAVSMTTLITTSARPGDTVLISGLGPVGLLAAVMFSKSGYQVFCVEPIQERREYAEARGLTTLAAIDDATFSENLPALVVECSGHEEAVLAAARKVRELGEIVLVGVPWKKTSDVSAFPLLYDVFHGYVTLRSGWEWELPRTLSHFAQNHTIFGNITTAMNWLNEWQNDDVIDIQGLAEVVQADDAVAVYHDLRTRNRKSLFTVFSWQ